MFLVLMGLSFWVVYEFKGVVLLIFFWNFLINLILGFLVFVIVVGNMVIIKFFEMMFNVFGVMKKLLGEIFEEKEIVVLEGGVSIFMELLKFFFNYIFFIGVFSIGKIVMRVVVEYLSLVILELGGKLFMIVDEIVNVEIVVRRIVWGKFVNNG